MNGQSTTVGPPSSSNNVTGDANNAHGILGSGPSNGEHTIDTAGGRILCIADIRGKISRLNELADRHGAKAIIHTGDFGFYDKDSVERITDRTLRHIVQYSSLIDPNVREKYFPLQANPKEPSRTPLSLGQLREALINPSPEQVAEQHGQDFILSEFPKLLRGEITLRVPVYTIWGACEDVHILEKIRLATDSTATSSNNSKSEYAIPNLTVLSEGVTRLLNIGGVKLRLFGLGGSLVYHKLFDNGEGNATIAGGNGTMWTTTLQIGELVDTAQRVFDPTETRMLITHASVGREGLLAQLALAIKADFTISASLHFRYSTSYNDFATQTNTESFRNKFVVANKSFMEVYDSVKTQVEGVIDDQQKKLLSKALGVANRLPSETGEEAAWKNSWHWNLPDALYGTLILEIREGRVGSEMRSTGFNFAYRLSGNNKQGHVSANSHHQQPQTNATSGSTQAGPSKKPGQVPFQQRQVPMPHAGSTPGAAQQEPSKQGYMGASRPPVEQAQASGPSSSGQAAAASGPAQTTDRASAGTPPVSRAPPTPRDFENLASIAFKKPVGHTGPHVGVASGPGAGRGRGSAPLRDYVAGGGHKKASSSATSSPAEPASNVKKDDAPKTEATADATDSSKKPVEGQNTEEGRQQQQRRTSGFVARRGTQRDDSANWRDRISQDDKTQPQSQSEASGNESPVNGPGSSFRGRGRGRGQFDSTRGGRVGANIEGGSGFRGGRGGAPRGSFDGGRGRGLRGGHRGGRGGSGEASVGDGQSSSAVPKSGSPAPEKPKVSTGESSA